MDRVTVCTLPGRFTSAPDNWPSAGKCLEFTRNVLSFLVEGGQKSWGSRLWVLWWRSGLAGEDIHSPWLLLLSLVGPVLPKRTAHWCPTAFTDTEDFTASVKTQELGKLNPRAFITCAQRLQLMLIITLR